MMVRFIEIAVVILLGAGALVFFLFPLFSRKRRKSSVDVDRAEDRYTDATNRVDAVVRSEEARRLEEQAERLAAEPWRMRPPYVGSSLKDVCEHLELLNRGSPPNTSNQRVCELCGRTFAPPEKVGDRIVSNDGGPIVWIDDNGIDRGADGARRKA